VSNGKAGPDERRKTSRTNEKVMEELRSREDLFCGRRNAGEAPLTSGSHEQLCQIAVKLPTDFEPYGQRTLTFMVATPVNSASD
jgi:hypothetical protein